MVHEPTVYKERRRPSRLKTNLPGFRYWFKFDMQDAPFSSPPPVHPIHSYTPWNRSSSFTVGSLQLLLSFNMWRKLEDGAHAKEPTHCSRHFFLLLRPRRQLICQSPPRPVIPVTQTDCLCRCYLVLREGTSTWPTPGRPPCQKIATLAESPLRCPSVASRRTHACTRTVGSVPRVAVGLLSQSVQALSLFVWRPLLLSQRVSLIKTGPRAKSRASAHLPETETAFDFHNPVTSARPWAHEHMLTWQERSGDANTSARQQRLVDVIDYVSNVNWSTGIFKRWHIVLWFL